MANKRRKYRAALTFIEIMIATVILLVAVLGTSAFRYSTALNARMADLQATASRIGLLLCESWRGSSDPNTFDPTVLSDDSGFVIEASGHSVDSGLPAGFTALGTYRVAAEGVDYYVVLSWKDLFTDLRALNVTVIWDQRGSNTSYDGRVDKSFRLTTYVSP
ncbi:MAG: type IV pilus modification PilV family protein [Planctomycetota bacterium]|jgi:hypothetical protein